MTSVLCFLAFAPIFNRFGVAIGKGGPDSSWRGILLRNLECGGRAENRRQDALRKLRAGRRYECVIALIAHCDLLSAELVFFLPIRTGLGSMFSTVCGDF